MMLLYFYFGSLITLSIYHLLVFIGRNKDYSNIAYAIYCLGIAGMLFSKHLMHKFYETDSVFSRTVFYAFCYLVAAAIPLIISTIFIDKIKSEKQILKFKKIKKFVQLYYLFMGILAIFLK